MKESVSDGVEGSVPTPLGKITASFNTTNGTCNINIPQGVKTTVGIPKVGKTIKNIHFEKGRWNKILTATTKQRKGASFLKETYSLFID